MKDTTQYMIPAGTLVSTRNVDSQLKMQTYLTKNDLWFDRRLNTGDGGFLSYFRYENWLIAVNSDSVNRLPHQTMRAAS